MRKNKRKLGQYLIIDPWDKYCTYVFIPLDVHTTPFSILNNIQSAYTYKYFLGRVRDGVAVPHSRDIRKYI